MALLSCFLPEGILIVIVIVIVMVIVIVIVIVIVAGHLGKIS